MFNWFRSSSSSSSGPSVPPIPQWEKEVREYIDEKIADRYTIPEFDIRDLHSALRKAFLELSVTDPSTLAGRVDAVDSYLRVQFPGRMGKEGAVWWVRNVNNDAEETKTLARDLDSLVTGLNPDEKVSPNHPFWRFLEDHQTLLPTVIERTEFSTADTGAFNLSTNRFFDCVLFDKCTFSEAKFIGINGESGGQALLQFNDCKVQEGTSFSGDMALRFEGRSSVVGKENAPIKFYGDRTKDQVVSVHFAENVLVRGTMFGDLERRGGGAGTYGLPPGSLVSHEAKDNPELWLSNFVGNGYVHWQIEGVERMMERRQMHINAANNIDVPVQGLLKFFSEGNSLKPLLPPRPNGGVPPAPKPSTDPDDGASDDPDPVESTENSTFLDSENPLEVEPTPVPTKWSYDDDILDSSIWSGPYVWRADAQKLAQEDARSERGSIPLNLSAERLPEVLPEPIKLDPIDFSVPDWTPRSEEWTTYVKRQFSELVGKLRGASTDIRDSFDYDQWIKKIFETLSSNGEATGYEVLRNGGKILAAGKSDKGDGEIYSSLLRSWNKVGQQRYREKIQELRQSGELL
jgi:hypothetical protein